MLHLRTSASLGKLPRGSLASVELCNRAQQASGIGWATQQARGLLQRFVVFQREHDNGLLAVAGNDQRFVVAADSVHRAGQVGSRRGVGDRIHGVAPICTLYCTFMKPFMLADLKAPNPSIEGALSGLRPPSAAHVKRCLHMKTIFSFAAALLLISVSPGAISAPPELSKNAAASTIVMSGEFGLFNLSDPSKPSFVPSASVPLVPDQAYGWIIRVRTDKAKIKWREEFTLPVKPMTWGVAEPVGTRSVSNDGRTSVTEREVSPDRGLIFNFWSVAPGDPKGRYIIRVFIDGSLAKAFEFEVK